MAALWMCELPPTEIAGSDAFNRNQLACRKALTDDRASKAGCVGTLARLLCVLVVDNDQDATDGLVRLVRRWGHAARFAYDGASGLKVAAAQHPDVVLLDIAMPLMDGCQFARQLRLDFVKKDCFIIAVTGNADEQCRLRCREAGIDVVLIKPVQPAILETLLMLECARMNRSQASHTVSVAKQGAAQISRKKPSAGLRDLAAQTAPFRRSASSASGLRPEMPT